MYLRDKLLIMEFIENNTLGDDLIDVSFLNKNVIFKRVNSKNENNRACNIDTEPNI